MTSEPGNPPAPGLASGLAPVDGLEPAAVPAATTPTTGGPVPASEPDRWAKLEQSSTTTTASATAAANPQAAVAHQDSLEPAPHPVPVTPVAAVTGANPTAVATGATPVTSTPNIPAHLLPPPPGSEHVGAPGRAAVATSATATGTPTRRWSKAERSSRRKQALLFLGMLVATVVMMIACGVIFYVKFMKH